MTKKETKKWQVFHIHFYDLLNSGVFDGHLEFCNHFLLRHFNRIIEDGLQDHDVYVMILLTSYNFK